jgi:hypothetical protein
MKNPISKTHFEFTKDRIQHYSNDLYICSGCNNQYHPKVHSQPYYIQFGAIILGLLLGALFISQSPVWSYFVAAFILLPYFYFYSKKERKISVGKLKYGDIILECPKCGSANANKAL